MATWHVTGNAGGHVCGMAVRHGLMPAASRSMADSKASPSTGPFSRSVLPVPRSRSCKAGVAEMPCSAALHRLSTDDGIGAIAVETALHGWRELDSAGPPADPARRHGCSRRATPRPARTWHVRLSRPRTRPDVPGSRGRLVHGQRQVVPLPVHLGMGVDPALERGK